MKYFKKIYSDRVACGIWREGDAINYNEPDDKSYTVEFIDESEYNTIKQQVAEYFKKIGDADILIEQYKRDLAIEKGVIENTLNSDGTLKEK